MCKKDWGSSRLRGWQNRSLGEYGSGWEWDKKAHAFDQTNEFIRDDSYNVIPDDTPIRYVNSGTKIDYCFKDNIETNGEILFSGSQYKYQSSCRANTGNTGNWYTWIVTNLSGDHLDSICPKNWHTIYNEDNNDKSWHYLIRIIYNIQDTKDDKIRSLPISLIRSGYYNQEDISQRGKDGFYWSLLSQSKGGYAYILYFSSGYLSPQDTYTLRTQTNFGMSIRCVAR